MEKSPLLNKDLAVPEAAFLNALANDFTGDGFTDQLEWAMLMIQQNFKQMHFARYLAPVTRSHFDKAYLMAGGPDSLNENLRFFQPFGAMQATPAIFPDLNVKVMTLNDSIQLSKVKQLNLRTQKALGSKLQYAYEFSNAFYKKDTEAFYGSRDGYELNKGFFTLFDKLDDDIKIHKTELPNPLSLHPGYRVPKDAIAMLPKTQLMDVMRLIAMAYQVALSMYYEWCIYIREYDNIGLIVPIEPGLLSELYKTSLLKFHSKKQMVHFVKEHYRRKPASTCEDYSVFVNRYLRGEHRFDYRGFYAEIIPPKYDLLRAKTRKKFIDGLN